MENRIRDRLADWAQMDDEALKADLEKKYAKPRCYSGGTLKRARDLFNLVLDEGVSYKYNSWFFANIYLAVFPVEAGLTPGFRVLDQIEASDMLAKARSQVLVKAFNGQIKPEWVFEYFAENLGEGSLASRLNDFVVNAHRFGRLIQSHGNVAGALDALADALKIDRGLEPENYTGIPSTHGILKLLTGFLPHINQIKGANASKLAVIIADAVAEPDNEVKTRAAGLAFFNAKHEPRKAGNCTYAKCFLKKAAWW